MKPAKTSARYFLRGYIERPKEQSGGEEFLTKYTNEQPLSANSRKFLRDEERVDQLYSELQQNESEENNSTGVEEEDDSSIINLEEIITQLLQQARGSDQESSTYA